jgi:glycine cleavage system H lipoate-binding protein
MESVDIFATKGIEYIFILGFLAVLIFFWKAINPEKKTSLARAAGKAMGFNWFPLDQQRYYHQGHTWVQPTGEGEALIGLDLLACKLLGPGKTIEIVSQHDKLVQGAEAMRIKVNGIIVPVISPIDGKIIAKNIDDDGCPGKNKVNSTEWLIKVKADNLKASLNNLLSGSLAQRWREDTEAKLNRMITPELGLVLQDGGEIQDGFGHHLPLESRNALIRDVFMAENFAS